MIQNVQVQNFSSLRLYAWVTTRIFSGDYRERVTPLPIPNREVKPPFANGTTTERLWESRALPGIFFKALNNFLLGAFFYNVWIRPTLPSFQDCGSPASGAG